MEVVTRWTLCVPPLWVVIFKKTNVVNFGVLLDIQNSERDFPTSSWRPSNGVAKTGRAVQAESSAHIASRFTRHIYCFWLVSCTNRFDLFNVFVCACRYKFVNCRKEWLATIVTTALSSLLLLECSFYWSFQRCRAFRSNLIVGRSDLRWLLHASAASSHWVGKEV